MKLGLSSYACRWSIGTRNYTPRQPLRPEEFVEIARSHGFDGVQLCDHLGLLDLSDERIWSIRSEAAARGMFIETGASHADHLYLRQMIEISQKLGSHLLRVILDVDTSGQDEHSSERFDRSIARIVDVLDEAKQAGVRLALENHAQISSKELRKIVSKINDPYVGVCLDTMNSIVLMERPTETARILAPFALTVHLKDFTIEPNPDGHRIIGVPLGEGMVDFPEILRLIRDSRREVTLNLELFVERKDTEEATAAWEAECIKRSLRCAREMLSTRTRKP